MTSQVVWVSPSATAKTAMILLKGHGVDALPVVYSHDSVVGMVYCSSLLGVDLDLPVMEIMSKEFTTVSPDMPVHQAAEMMKTNGRSHLLAVEAGKLVGIVARGDVVNELGKSYDTLTGLPWQDALREWAINALDQGREISIILIDLNLFGRFNKKYGHVMGDNVLKAVAGVLRSGTDPSRDFLCRYAGDEFAIASYRPAKEAFEFGTALMRGISEISIPGLPEKIGACFGVAGGRRAAIREQVHTPAMLDDLITNASLNCTLSKPHRQETAPETAGTAPSKAADVPERAHPVHVSRSEAARLKIQTIKLSTTSTEASADVILSRAGEEYLHSASGYSVGGRTILRLVAEATAGAVAKSLAPGHGISIEDVLTLQAGGDREVVMVIASFLTPNGGTTHAGSAFVRRADPYRAAAAAVLCAMNRQIAAAPQAEKIAPKEELKPSSEQIESSAD